MRFFAFFTIILTGCYTAPVMAPPFQVADLVGDSLRFCAPRYDWTEDETLARCGEPAAWVALEGAEVIRCAVYTTQAVRDAASRVVVCFAPPGQPAAVSLSADSPSTPASDSRSTRARRVAGIVGLR